MGVGRWRSEAEELDPPNKALVQLESHHFVFQVFFFFLNFHTLLSWMHGHGACMENVHLVPTDSVTLELL